MFYHEPGEEYVFFRERSDVILSVAKDLFVSNAKLHQLVQQDRLCLHTSE